MAKAVSTEILELLIEERASRQLSWTELAELCEEQTGKSIDWRTLKNQIIRLSGGRDLPKRVSKNMVESITYAFETSNALVLAMKVIGGVYNEWSLLYNQHTEYMAVRLEDRTTEDMPKALSAVEVARMDSLRKDIVSFFFQGIRLMKDAESSTEVLQRIFGEGMKAGAVAGLEVGSEVESLRRGDVMLKANEIAEGFLVALNDKNRAEATGSYRRMLTEKVEDEYGDAEALDSDTG